MMSVWFTVTFMHSHRIGFWQEAMCGGEGIQKRWMSLPRLLNARLESPLISSVTGPQDISHPGRIQRFLLILLKPKHHRLDVLTTGTHVTVRVCHAHCVHVAWWFSAGVRDQLMCLGITATTRVPGLRIRGTPLWQEVLAPDKEGVADEQCPGEGQLVYQTRADAVR